MTHRHCPFSSTSLTSLPWLLCYILGFSIFVFFFFLIETQESISKQEVTERKNEYSVWAFPPEVVRVRVKKLMKELRSEFGGPEFEPHITVIGPISLTAVDALKKFRSACEGLKVYNATVGRITANKWVFRLVHPTPQVMGISDHFISQFGYNRSSPYVPHMGLLYGDFSDEEKKEAQERANALDDVSGLSFQISRLALYKTDTEDKTLKSWEKITDCVLIPS